MAKFAEDDRIEQMTAQKRRMKQLGMSIHIISTGGLAMMIRKRVTYVG